MPRGSPRAARHFYLFNCGRNNPLATPEASILRKRSGAVGVSEKQKKSYEHLSSNGVKVRRAFDCPWRCSDPSQDSPLTSDNCSSIARRVLRPPSLFSPTSPSFHLRLSRGPDILHLRCRRVEIGLCSGSLMNTRNNLCSRAPKLERSHCRSISFLCDSSNWIVYFLNEVSILARLSTVFQVLSLF